MAQLVRLQQVSDGLFAALVAETGQRVALGPAHDVQELADLCSFKLALDRGLDVSGVQFWSPTALEELRQDAEVRAQLFEVVASTICAQPRLGEGRSTARRCLRRAGARCRLGALPPEPRHNTFPDAGPACRALAAIPAKPGNATCACHWRRGASRSARPTCTPSRSGGGSGLGGAAVQAPVPASGAVPAASDLIIPDSEDEDTVAHGSSQPSPAGDPRQPLAAPAAGTQVLLQQERQQLQNAEGQPAQLAAARGPSAIAGAASTGAAAGTGTQRRWQVLPGGGGVQKVLPKGGKGMLHLNLSGELPHHGVRLMRQVLPAVCPGCKCIGVLLPCAA